MGYKEGSKVPVMKVLRFSFFILFTGLFFFSMGVFVGKSWSDRQSVSGIKKASPKKVVGKRDKIKAKKKKGRPESVREGPEEDSTGTSYTSNTSLQTLVRGESERWDERDIRETGLDRKRINGVFIKNLISGSGTVPDPYPSRNFEKITLEKDKAPKEKRIFYTIQVAAYETEEEAQSHVQNLIDKGFPAFLLEKTVGGQKWFRVNIGSFKVKKEALRYEKALKKQTWIKKSFVRKISHSSENQFYVR